MKKLLSSFTLLILLQGYVQAQKISLVADITQGSGSTLLNVIKPAAGKLFFTNGSSLWVSDGTGSSIPTLLSPAGVTGITRLAAANNKLYFTATDTAHGSELWCSDGTVAGTHILRDIQPGTGSFFDAPYGVSDTLEYHNARFTFIKKDSANQWSAFTYNGTDTGLVYKTNLPANLSYIFSTKLNSSGQLYLYAADTINNKAGLFIMNTVQDTATFLLPAYFGVNRFMELGNKMIFAAADSFTGSYLHITDGTVAGTQNLNLEMDGNNSIPEFLVSGNILYFYDDHFPVTGTAAKRIIKTDGTVQGTVVLKSGFLINSIATNTAYTNKKIELTALNSKVYFSVTDSNQAGIWQTDGTTAGTIKILKTVGSATKLTAYRSHLYFTCLDSTSFYIGKTDGTPSGAIKIKDPLADVLIPYGPNLVTVNAYRNPDMQVYNDALYYTATYYAAIGKELYKLEDYPTGITIANPGSAMQLYPNPASSMVTVEVKDFMYLDITSTEGKVLLHSNSKTLNVSSLPAGVYIIKAATSNGVITEKLLKN